MTTPVSDKPRIYTPKMPATWWLTNRKYLLFMLRELTSVFIAIFLVVFLILIAQLGRGPEAYAAFMRRLESPVWIIFSVVAVPFVLYHTFTWFGITSRVQVVRLGERTLPPALLMAVSVGAWLLVSLVILLVFLFARR